MIWADRCRNAVAVGWPLLRIDARRPANWISGVTAVVAGAWLAAGDGSGPLVAAAIASGGVLGVAAIGRLPVGVPAASRRPWRWPLLTRTAWPAAGFLGGAVARAWSGDDAGPLPCLLALTASVAIALIAAFVVARQRRNEATIASILLGITAAGAASAVAIWAAGGGPGLQALGGLLTGGLVAAGLVLDHGGDVRDWFGSMPGRRSVPETGPFIAMTASLAAMVGWYFLAPQYAWAYALLATALFVCLAVPPATEATPATKSLLWSAAGRPPLPGSLPRAFRVTAVYLGILGWPALVAFVLPTAFGERVGGPVVTVLSLASAGACLLALATVAARTGQGEAARAALLAIAAGAAIAAAKPPAGFPGLPILPACIQHDAREARLSGVEPLRSSCKTPHSAQPSTPAMAAKSRIEIQAFVAR